MKLFDNPRKLDFSKYTIYDLYIQPPISYILLILQLYYIVLNHSAQTENQQIGKDYKDFSSKLRSLNVIH